MKWEYWFPSMGKEDDRTPYLSQGENSCFSIYGAFVLTIKESNFEA